MLVPEADEAIPVETPDIDELDVGNGGFRDTVESNEVGKGRGSGIPVPDIVPLMVELEGCGNGGFPDTVESKEVGKGRGSGMPVPGIVQPVVELDGNGNGGMLV